MVAAHGVVDHAVDHHAEVLRLIDFQIREIDIVRINLLAVDDRPHLDVRCLELAQPQDERLDLRNVLRCHDIADADGLAMLHIVRDVAHHALKERDAFDVLVFLRRRSIEADADPLHLSENPRREVLRSIRDEADGEPCRARRAHDLLEVRIQRRLAAALDDDALRPALRQILEQLLELCERDVLPLALPLAQHPVAAVDAIHVARVRECQLDADGE